MSKTVCFIPARKNSKGIPGKNLKELGGKPLICWVIDSVLASGIAECVWVATDSEQIESLIHSHYNGIVNVYRRSKQSARDDAAMIEIIKEFLDASSFDNSDRFILLQATSPFTRAEELCYLLHEMKKKEYDSFIACCRVKKFSWNENGYPLDYIFENKPRRQEYRGLLLESGAFYASTVGQIKGTSQLISGKVKVIEISQGGLIDIDEPKDWKLAENYLNEVGISYDFYVEFYEEVDDLLSEIIQAKQLPQPTRSYLFQHSFRLKEEYNRLRMKGQSVDECKAYLLQYFLPIEVKGEINEKSLLDSDYQLEPWYEVLVSLSNQLLIYIYNNRQLYYLLPLINALNRPVVLLCESSVDEKVEVNENVKAIDLCFWNNYKVYKNETLEAYFPELFRYYNTFQLLLEILKPEGIIVLEGCHYKEQILSDVARQMDIPSIAIQQGWPSLMHSMFRHMPYSYYLTWGADFDKEWKKWNPDIQFISIGYPYSVKEKLGNSITFFLQAPLLISDSYYLSLIIELVIETAQKYPNILILVKEHPEYKVGDTITNRFSQYNNIQIVSEWNIADVYAKTLIVVSHFSSTLMEGIAHNCIPLIFDPTRFSRYTPDVEEIGFGRIASNKVSFFEKLEHILNNSSQYLANILMEKGNWFTAISDKAIDKAISTINRIAGCNYLKTTNNPCLHLGCGPFCLDGWLNTDICCSKLDIYYLDAGRNYPFPDNSFNYIYSEHLFEHLDLEQATRMLQECFRILIPGGKLRLAMPNFHFLMDLYFHPEEETNRKYLDWSYSRFIHKKINLNVDKRNYPVYVINNFFHDWGHNFIHTPENLTEIATALGFVHIQTYPIGNSDTPIFKAIENHQKEISEWVNELETFVVEMEKAK